MRRVQIKEISSVVSKGTTPTTHGHSYKEFGIPLLRVNNIDSGKFDLEDVKYIDEKAHADLKRSQLVKGDLIISIAGSIGKTAIVEESILPANCNQALAFVRLEKEKVDIRYAQHWLNSDDAISQITKNKVTATISNLSLTQIKNLEIPLPSLSEQKAIVAKLDRAQRLIDIDREMLAKYDELIQSMFLEMFGDPVRNEKGWEVKPLKKIAEIDKESFDPTDFNGSVNYVGLNCIVKETGKIIDVETITEGDVKSTKFKFSPNHILYGKLRPYLNKVAFPDFHGVCSTDILPILPKEGISTRSYIGHLLKSKEFVNYADKNSSGANLPRISPTMIKKFEAIHPPFNLQKKFEEILNKVNFEKSKTSQALKKSEELFSSLVQGVFG